jgi:hypothetical protein
MPEIPAPVENYALAWQNAYLLIRLAVSCSEGWFR